MQLDAGGLCALACVVEVQLAACYVLCTMYGHVNTHKHKRVHMQARVSVSMHVPQARLCASL